MSRVVYRGFYSINNIAISSTLIFISHSPLLNLLIHFWVVCLLTLVTYTLQIFFLFLLHLFSRNAYAVKTNELITQSNNSIGTSSLGDSIIILWQLLQVFPRITWCPFTQMNVHMVISNTVRALFLLLLYL